MPLIEHLLELRQRLMWAALAVIVAAIGGWFLSEPALDLMSAPIRSAGNKRLAEINFGSVTSAFDTRLELSIVIGLLIASPIWLFQIFAFLTPAFTRQEKKYVFGFFFSAVPLFLLGCAAGLFVVPHIVGLMVSFAIGDSTSLFDAKGYVDFVLRLMVVIGVAFVLPVFLVLLDFVGVISGKAILKAWRVAILAITLFTAIATPSADVISMILLAIPMVILYFAAVGVSLVHDKQVAKRNAEALTDAGSL